MSKILIVDDDAQLRQSFNKLLCREGYDVAMAATGEAAVSMVRESSPDLVILDVRLPGMDGLETLEELLQIDSRLPVIIMTAYTTTDTAIKATQRGAFDYVIKPFDIPDILKLILEALEVNKAMRAQGESESQFEPGSMEGLIGTSKAMQDVYKAIGRTASSDATVLIRGESGTGKELVARAIYQYSRRSDKPFVVINCVAIPDTLLESELFGYEKGAFTGAHNRHLGKIELGQRGTVFFDEIGDMPMGIQAKVLRLLQEKKIERLGGGGEVIPVDVRIIAATKTDLEAAIEQGKFREDLYYRLKVVTIQLPPLRERPEDIPLLADFFLSRFSTELGFENPGVSEEAKKLLGGLPWPGNVRELANTMQKALIFNRGCPIRPEDISPVMNGREPQSGLKESEVEEVLRKWVRQRLVTGFEDNLFDVLMDGFGSALVGEALELSGGNRSRAAKMLGISRPTLQSKIEKYHLRIDASIKQE